MWRSIPFLFLQTFRVLLGKYVLAVVATDNFKTEKIQNALDKSEIRLVTLIL